MHYPPESGDCPPQLHKNISTLITVQSGLEWFELFGLFRLFQLFRLLQCVFDWFSVFLGFLRLFF